MPRSRASGGGRSRSPVRTARRSSPVRSAPRSYPVASRAPSGAGSPQMIRMQGPGLGSALATGAALGVGSAIGHRAVDAMAGLPEQAVPRGDEYGGGGEATYSGTPLPAAPATQPLPQVDPRCQGQFQSFVECVNRNLNRVSACDFNFGLLRQCQRDVEASSSPSSSASHSSL
eukprot:gnl/Hemi2/15437_TR5192_c0_g1_i1.p1 gnl/Hemi2/15437_TR5192_c0_g1~~gnl/Hemi2/15437_TR5192_c0_g1_i1.p1  ORF type:complete len:173 (+),score=0.25 gnl/Hemi2/15437_TR5192_c0_g1_i1:79-597(+)